MLEEIKKIQGINHDDFDDMINIWVASAKQDLINIGINEELVDDATNPLIQTTIIQFVLSQLDVANTEMYFNSYTLLKDTLRRVQGYAI